ncbi:MAG: hypothetical protein ACLTER_14190 [Ruminococcus sp.]
MEEDVPREISTMVSGYNDLVSRIEENIILAYKNRNKPEKDRTANAAIPDQSSFFIQHIKYCQCIGETKWN